MNNTLLFSRFGKQENFRELLAKEEEEEILEDVQRDSKDVKDCNQCSSMCCKMQVKVLLL